MSGPEFFAGSVLAALALIFALVMVAKFLPKDHI
jgi:hypothetical protein